MNQIVDYSVRLGWEGGLSMNAAEIYDEAFGRKFSAAMPDKEKRIAVLAEGFLPAYGFCVLAHDEILGLAGFQTKNGALTGGITLSMLIRNLGFFGGIRAGVILGLLERKPAKRELLMDGIVVGRPYRGNGFGTLLLDEIIKYAETHYFDSVRLDVIDDNPRAKKLYEARGFVAKKHNDYRRFKGLIGFSGATTMVFNVKS